MSSSITTNLTAQSLDQRMTAMALAIGRAMSNLEEAQAGYPSSTPGASSASGPSMEPDGLNAVERLAMLRDPARRDLDELHRLVAALCVPVDQLYALVVQWGYLVLTPETLEDDHLWCTSCIRSHTLNPVYRQRLCWFCFDMLRTYGHRPTLNLLDKHARGRVSRKDREQDGPKVNTKRGRRHRPRVLPVTELA